MCSYAVRVCNMIRNKTRDIMLVFVLSTPGTGSIVRKVSFRTSFELVVSKESQKSKGATSPFPHVILQS